MQYIWSRNSDNSISAMGKPDDYAPEPGETAMGNPPGMDTEGWVWMDGEAAPRMLTGGEVLAIAKAAKAASLAASLKPYFESQWSDVERFAADYPTVANEQFVAVYGAHRLACSQAVAAAIAVTNAATTVESVNAVTVTWPTTPEKPQ